MKKKNSSLVGKRVAVIYHELRSEEKTDYYSQEHTFVDNQVTEIIDYVTGVLKKHRLKTSVVRVSPEHLEEMKNLKVDFIFNLVDSKAMELQIAKILDRIHIRHSGSSFEALRNSNNKIKSKYIFQSHGLPTPGFITIKPGDRLTRNSVPGKFPLIVKPAFEHCSLGITAKSIATNYLQLKAIIKRLRRQFQQTLVCEEFIKGEELQVTVLEMKGQTVALPVAELKFIHRSRNKWNIYGYVEKWDRDSKIYQSAQFFAPPKKVPAEVCELIQRDAIRAFYALGFKDYCRFDVRYSQEKKQWYFLEGNANPGISTESGDAMGESIKAHGMNLDEFIIQIVRNSQ